MRRSDLVAAARRQRICHAPSGARAVSQNPDQVAVNDGEWSSAEADDLSMLHETHHLLSDDSPAAMYRAEYRRGRTNRPNTVSPTGACQLRLGVDDGRRG